MGNTPQPRGVVHDGAVQSAPCERLRRTECYEMERPRPRATPRQSSATLLGTIILSYQQKLPRSSRKGFSGIVVLLFALATLVSRRRV